MYSYLFCSPIFHDSSFHCSLLLIYTCELLLLMSYSFSFSLDAPFHFLRAAMPPVNLSSAFPPPVFVVYHYHVSPMYVHCHHHIVLTSFSSSRPVYFPLFVSGCSFSCSSSHRVLFFSLVFFMFLCARIFLVCAIILLLYIYTAQ